MRLLSFLLLAMMLVYVGSVRINSMLLTTPTRLELRRTPENMNETPQSIPLQSFPVHMSPTQVKPSSTIERCAVEDILVRLESMEEKLVQVKVEKPVTIWEVIVAVKGLIVLCMPYSYLNYFDVLPSFIFFLLLGTPVVELLVYVLFRSLLRNISSLKK